MASLLQTASRTAASSARSTASRTMARLRTSLVILLTLNVVLLFALVRGTGASEADRRAEITRLEADERSARQHTEQLRALRQKVEAATQNEYRFGEENFLARSSAFSQMIADLAKLAEDNHLQPSDTSYSEPDRQANGLGWTSVTASMTVQGEYADLVRFINKVEKSQLFWIIQSLDVSGQSGSQLRLNLQAATYLLPS